MCGRVWVEQFFVLRITQVGHPINRIYCIETIYGGVFYINPSLVGYSHIHEIPSPHGIYIATLFVDHHPTNPLIGRCDYITCLLVLPSIKRLKWSIHLTHYTLKSVDTIQLQTHHFDNFIRPGKTVSPCRSTNY